jgi:hypothetical protein
LIWLNTVGDWLQFDGRTWQPFGNVVETAFLDGTMRRANGKRSTIKSVKGKWQESRQ